MGEKCKNGHCFCGFQDVVQRDGKMVLKLRCCSCDVVRYRPYVPDVREHTTATA